MRLKPLLMPMVTSRMLSEDTLYKQRRQAEKKRARKSLPHEVHYFHQVDDPYSALTAQVLGRLMQRYPDVQWVFHVVEPPEKRHAPERERLVQYSREDAERLAAYWGLKFVDLNVQPERKVIQQVQSLLVAALNRGLPFSEVASRLSVAMWSSPQTLPTAAEALNGVPDVDGLEPAHLEATQTRVQADTSLRQSLGHYLGATFYYSGEWYWGLDRLHYLEQRLQDLGCDRRPGQPHLFPPVPENVHTRLNNPDLTFDFYFSFRSPYSAIVAPRVFEMAKAMGVKVNLRYVLPMVMRGLPVPAEKRKYIVTDTAREARLRGIPFGRINDPVGKPTERGLSLIPYAESIGKAQEYICSFMKGVWSEGIDAGSDRGLRRIAERAGLNWPRCKQALNDEGWRKVAEKNREALFNLGLWGVPSFTAGDCAVWGQDRLWWVQQALINLEQKQTRGVA